METLTDDLKALVTAKELTLEQAVELNKQKSTPEDVPKLVNLFDDDEHQYEKSIFNDLVNLRSGTFWKENGKVALLSPRHSRQPGNRVEVFCTESDDYKLWNLIHVRNIPHKTTKTKLTNDKLPEHPLQPGIHGISIPNFLKLFGSPINFN